jgi:hypothetical protein
MRSSTATFVADALGKLAGIAAELAPIPYLGTAVGGLQQIIQLCDNVRLNK